MFGIEKKSIYVVDGRAFDNKEQAYDFFRNKIINQYNSLKIISMNINGEIIPSEKILDLFEDVQYVYLPDIEALSLFQRLSEYFNYYHAPRTIGFSRYDDDDDCWISLKEELKKFLKTWKAINLKIYTEFNKVDKE